MRKRIFSALLTLCMVCTLLPAQLTLAAWTGSWNGSWYGTWDGQAAELSDNIGFNYGVGGHLLVTMPTTPGCFTFGTTSSDGLTIIETGKNATELPTDSIWNWAVKREENEGELPTYTLILSSANITSNSGDAIMIGKSSGNDKVMNLNLVIKGNNTITSPSTAIAIYNNKRVTVSEDGSLAADGGSLGFFADLTDALEIGDQVKLNAKGGTGAGLQALKGTLTISTRGEGQAVTKDNGLNARAIKAKTIVIDPNVELYEGTIGSYDNWGESIKAAGSPAKWRRKYTITATAGAGGSISPTGATVVNKGANQSYTITPNSGYAIEEVKVDGVSKGALSSYTFDDVKAGHTITVTFKAISSGGSASGGGGGGGNTYTPSYTVTTDRSKTEHGQLVLDKEKATAGEMVKLTPKAEAGYEIDTLVVKDDKGNSIEVTKNADGTYSFKMPSGKVTIETTFKESQKEPATPSTNEQPTTWENTFNDVAETNWYYEAVKFVNEKKLFVGSTENSFEPEQLMTRAMVWTVLGRLQGEELSGEDVFEKARRWAMENKVSDGSNPSGNVLREQLVTMLWQYSGSPKANGTLTNFKDANLIADYAKEAMAWAVEKGIVSGTGDGKLAPKNNATRAEVAALFMTYRKMLEK